MVSSLALGGFAYQASKQDALETWEHAYVPAVKIIDYALGASGYRRVTHPDLMQKVMRGLPLRTDEEGSFWWCGGGDWLVLIAKADGGTTPVIYFRTAADGRPPPLAADWTRVGGGWTGFEGTLERVTALPARVALRAVSPGKPREKKDPLLLNY